MKYLIAVITVLFLAVVATPLAASGRKSSEESAPVDSQELQRMQSAFVAVPEEEKPVPKASLSGKITDEDGNPLKGVEVQCIDNEGKAVAEGVTDEQGSYLFEDLPEGEYTIQVSYSGYEWKKIEFDTTVQLPSIPRSLVLYEIAADTNGDAMLRAQWDHVRGATHYRCELIRVGDVIPIREYPDMMQNFCEFGGLEPDTAYEVHVYSKNDAGYSAESAKSRSRTRQRRGSPAKCRRAPSA